ncbi:MAG: cupin domain-containing protein [Nitrospinota bacterium]
MSESGEATFVYRAGAPGVPRKLAEGVMARVFFGERVMFSIVTIEPHTDAPVHSHPNEQWGYLLEGEWERYQDGQRVLCRQGDFWHTPAGAEHGGRTGASRAVILDVFSPPREDYKTSNL